MKYQYAIIKETGKRVLIDFRHSYIEGEWWYQIDGSLYAASSLEMVD